MKPRTDSEQRQRRLYTHLGTVAGRAEGNWIYIYIYIFIFIYLYLYIYIYMYIMGAGDSLIFLT